jgi:hypothetical protein
MATAAALLNRHRWIRGAVHWSHFATRLPRPRTGRRRSRADSEITYTLNDNDRDFAPQVAAEMRLIHCIRFGIAGDNQSFARPQKQPWPAVNDLVS